VTSAAPTLTITAGAPSALNSTVSLSSATDVSGSGVTVTLQAVDVLGNLVKTGGATVLFSLGSNSGGQGNFSAVTDKGNGTYTAIFTGSKAGSNTITATLGGQTVTTTAPAITVNPGPASLANSFVSLSLPSVGIGSTLTATLQAEDAAGNLVKTGGLAVTFAMGSTSGGLGTFSAVTDNKNGTYTSTFTGTVLGTNTVTAKIGTSAVTSAPASITVTPGPISAAKSVVSLSTSSVSSGNSLTVTLQAEDASGNKITTGGATVGFLTGSASGGQGSFSQVTDNLNGTYTATLTGTTVGANTVKATVNNLAVTTTAPAFTVTPNLANSFVSLSSLTVASGSTVTITLQAEDGSGNKVTTGGDVVVLSLGSTSGATGTLSAVTDNKNGTYTATFTGIRAGANTITATLDGQPLSSTAPSITVTPGPISLANSFVAVQFPSVVGGGVDTVGFQAVDAAGNNLTTGGAAVSFALGSTSGGQGTFGTVTDNQDGTYIATFTAGAKGTNTIIGKVGNVAVSTPAAPITITNVASLTLSKVSSSASTVSIGSVITVTVQLVDNAGTNLTAGGLTVSFALASPTGGQGTFGTVVDNHDGTYTVSFLATAVGFNNIRGFIGGSLITSGAPAVTITN
jgi:adhesin/invasin